MAFEKKDLKKRSKNLSDWYNDVVVKAELADYGPAKGSMVIRPYGFALWERVQEIFNSWIKPYGVENAYFPLLIPMSLMEKEKSHVKGFSPELAVVTHGGGKELAEPLAVRPTSKTIMYHMYSKWIKSHRDLPLLINQWNNVVRWELRTYLFLRTAEFLWQEGHTAHATEEEAIKMQTDALAWYRKLYEEHFAMPVVVGIKSEKEKFAGAKTTYSVEALMPDGKALQAGTSHNLGQNFSKAFEISFQDAESNSQHVWQTSWGLSTRSLGGLFLTHGDDQGLLLPPKLAPTQVVILPINNSQSEKVIENILERLISIDVRARVDNREELSLGRKINYWELKGVPLRIEIGDKELADESVTVIRRDTFEKTSLKLDKEFSDHILHLLTEIQDNLFNTAKKFLTENTHEVDSYDQFKEIMKTKRGFIKAYWCEDSECEAKIKSDTKATTRVRELDQKAGNGKCVHCGKPAKFVWHFAQAY